MRKLLLTINCSLLTISVFADNRCLHHKPLASSELKVPSFSVSVIQPEKPMALMHGNVVATFSEAYQIEYGAAREGNGWCVFIEHITAEIGYTDFVIQIDRRHRFDSCEFNAIKTHENKHVRAYLSVIDDGKEDIKNSILAAAGTVLPIYVENEHGIDVAMDELEEMLQSRPQIRLMRQRLSAEQEIRNRRIDMQDSTPLKDCAD